MTSSTWVHSTTSVEEFNNSHCGIFHQLEDYWSTRWSTIQCTNQSVVPTELLPVVKLLYLIYYQLDTYLHVRDNLQFSHLTSQQGANPTLVQAVTLRRMGTVSPPNIPRRAGTLCCPPHIHWYHFYTLFRRESQNLFSSREKR